MLDQVILYFADGHAHLFTVDVAVVPVADFEGDRGARDGVFVAWVPGKVQGVADLIIDYIPRVVRGAVLGSLWGCYWRVRYAKKYHFQSDCVGANALAGLDSP